MSTVDHAVTIIERRTAGGTLRRLGYLASCSCGRWTGQPAKTPGKAARQHRRHRGKTHAITAQEKRRRAARGEPRGGKRPVTPPDELDRILARHAAERVRWVDVSQGTRTPGVSTGSE